MDTILGTIKRKKPAVINAIHNDKVNKHMQCNASFMAEMMTIFRCEKFFFLYFFSYTYM